MMSYPYRALHEVNAVSATPTEAETEFIDDHKTDLETYAKETLSKLCLGEYSIDDLPKFVQRLDDMDLREYVEIAGARYRRSHPAE